jgi:hypothetical protein
MRQRRIGEFELIQRLRNATRIPRAVRSAVLTGIGDDAAEIGRASCRERVYRAV